MALSLRRGRVTAVVERLPELVRCEVDDTPCVAYPRLTGPVEEGDEVIVNIQARDLELGSGGFDVLHVNLTRGLDLPADAGAHVMKLPYTSLQHAVPHAEETEQLVRGLAGMPVVCCSLHSQVAPVCAGIGEGTRTAYVQLPGGALPVSLSDAVRALKQRGLVEVAVAVGACIDGDVHCVSTASALAWTKAAGFDAAVCAIGPGIVGPERSSATAGSLRPRLRTLRPRSAVSRSSRRGSRRRMTESAIAVCPTTRTPSSSSASARSRSRSRATPRAGARPARGCRSRTWGADQTRIPRFSLPDTPPVASHADMIR